MRDRKWLVWVYVNVSWGRGAVNKKVDKGVVSVTCMVGPTCLCVSSSCEPNGFDVL